MTEIAKEYGAALFMLALEEQKAEEISNELMVIKSVFQENPQFEELLASPNISLSERLQAISAVFSEKSSQEVLNFLMLLCEKGRMACLWDAVLEYNRLYDLSQRVSLARVTSAVELSEEQKLHLKEKLELRLNAKVNMEFLIDTSLLGGVTVEVDGKVLDGSLRHRLSDVKDVIST